MNQHVDSHTRPTLQMRYTLSRDHVAQSREAQLVYMLIELMCPEGVSPRSSRMPINLCLILDRSSSMSGERLARVKQAAGKIVDQLGVADFFSVVVFNDRAQTIVPSQRVADKQSLKQTIDTVVAAGGTEMASGLAQAMHELQRPRMAHGSGHLLLLTDGQTYGDADHCIALARRMQHAGVGITALGIGSDWNEDLLEALAAGGKSHVRYIDSAGQVCAVFEDELNRICSVFARDARLHIDTRPGCVVRSIDRLHPFIAPLPLAEVRPQQLAGNLGDLAGCDSNVFLLEVIVPPMAPGLFPVLKLHLQYDLANADVGAQSIEDIVRLSVLPADQRTAPAHAAVKHELERLVAYRLQMQAWRDVDAGRIDDATRRLQMAGTRLFGAGEKALAQTLHAEATRLLSHEQVSDEGRKRIRFGTRGLMNQQVAELGAR